MNRWSDPKPARVHVSPSDHPMRPAPMTNGPSMGTSEKDPLHHSRWLIARTRYGTSGWPDRSCGDDGLAIWTGLRPDLPPAGGQVDVQTAIAEGDRSRRMGADEIEF